MSLDNISQIQTSDKLHVTFKQIGYQVHTNANLLWLWDTWLGI